LHFFICFSLVMINDQTGNAEKQLAYNEVHLPTSFFVIVRCSVDKDLIGADYLYNTITSIF
jgi:hypothetical protein